MADKDDKATGSEQDLTARHVLAFTVGTYLGVNAIRDGFLVVDGPDCAYMRTQYIQGNHDYLACLSSVTGQHKVVNTALEPGQAMGSREEPLVELFVEIASAAEVGCLLTTSMPMASVLGIDYDRLCRQAGRRVNKPIIPIPGKSLSDDWLGGYEQTLDALARHIPLEDIAPGPEKVAVVGLLFDRNEGDCRANVAELESLLCGLGLEPVSIWLDGRNFENLGKIAEAGTIISLPYGRRAAKTLAKRIGAQLIETELPFGLPASERWVRQIAAACGRQELGETLIETCLARTVPSLEWVVPAVFAKRRFAYIGDPHLLPGFVETVDLFGGTLGFALVTNFSHHLTESGPVGNIKNLMVEPRTDSMVRFLSAHLGPNRLDCVVTNSTCVDAMSPTDHAIVEFGFPSYNVHALYRRPYLGFEGALAFADTLANQMRLFKALSDVVPLPDATS